MSVLKIGGSTLENLQPAFFNSLHNKIHQGEKVVIVHGGGPEINKKLKEKGLPIQKKDGIRITSEEALSCVKTALMDEANNKLVDRLQQEGIQAVGLSGSENTLIQCEFLDQEKYGFVGKVINVNIVLLEELLIAGKVPVIASLGVTENGEEVNINADTVAGEAAAALSAESVCFVTDISGVQIEGKKADQLSVTELKQGIVDGHIYGGMIPKVEATVNCLNLNIKEVLIADQTLTGTRCYKEVLVT
ncbi:acetylglutamate kinase [Fictibacillus phosphorivorans]|uniref:acetylglutamate kinase n=1 Tax=Fictibacillus phosphorivorans TaxID=1221500 RepID=UPI00203C51F5|nr:acetylglutamate kinase [Fictibacillus phosphorivorans]MCM3718778.1 acetylglutamate kinase [Fictibacillus phosphorivorans]MCM3776401.1 acetylglutamate kinase [Fictibacillus phosphorivorans]